MKKVICIICLMLILLTNGCNGYWYQPGKTLEQCSEDIIECKCKAKKSGFFPLQLGFLSNSPSPMDQYYITCMRLKGYQSYRKEYLPPEVRISPDSYAAGK